MLDSGFQELLEEFLLEARERVDAVEDLFLRLGSGSSEERRENLAHAKRELHTLKGNSGMMGFASMQQIAHAMEDEVETLDLEAPRIDDLLLSLDALRIELDEVSSPRGEDSGTPEDEAEEEGSTTLETGAGSVRVPFSRIDELVELQAEALIFRNRLVDAMEGGKRLLEDAEDLERRELLERLEGVWEDVLSAQEALEKSLNQLQEEITELGMVPLQSLFRSLGRIVHDESSRHGKKVELEIHGGDTPIEKTLLEVAGEALGHLVRNAVIHGIEDPEKRRKAGKPETGTVRVEAGLEAGEIRIGVLDDGGGVDLDALRRKAREQGTKVEGAGERPWELLFAEGVSTHAGADLGAGRGVGMSAVRRSVERQGGRIEVDTKLGTGTRFSLHLPVAASILRSLLVTVDGEEYALPLGTVAESLPLEEQKPHFVHRSLVVTWRGRTVPLLDLGLALGTADRPRRDGYLVVIEHDERRRGLLIDEILGIRDIVVKGLDTLVGHPVGIAGSTILGDGRVIMILDPAGLLGVSPEVGVTT